MTGRSHPTALDLEMDSERGRWLRRRFLWYCALNVLCSAPLVSPALQTVRSLPGQARIAFIVFFSGIFGGSLLFAAAFVYAWKCPPNRHQILRLAFWLSCITGVVPIVCVRVGAAIAPESLFVAPANATRPSAAPDNAIEPTSGPLRITPPTVSMFISQYLIFIAHLFPCVFIPWTVRESLPLTAWLLGTFLVITTFDVATGHVHPFFALGAGMLTIVLIVPGLALCWLRDRRFRKRFQLSFESRGYRKLQNELADARRVHESCLPEQIDSGPLRLHYVYEPMRQIGGDLLFTFLHCGGEQASLSAVLLDVTGHGITAALTVSRLVGELQRIFAENSQARPGQVLESLNRYVHLTLARHSLYATAICWRIDVERDLLEYANGGHPSAFLRRRDGTIEMLASTAFLLGLEADGAFQPAPVEIRFSPGDALVAYTDGAAEAKNSRDTMLGMAGVRRILESIAHDNHAPPDWPGQVLRHVLDYRGAPPDDDTLVAAVFRPIT